MQGFRAEGLGRVQGPTGDEGDLASIPFGT